MSETPTVNFTLDIAKAINPEVQALVLKLFAKVECTDQLRAENPEVYFLKSSQVFDAIVACACQQMLEDGLMRHRLSSKMYNGPKLAWELFLLNNPAVATKVAVEKAAKQSGYMTKLSVVNNEDDSGLDENGDEKEEDDEDNDDE